MADDVADLSEARFSKLFEQKNAAAKSSVQKKRSMEAQSMAAEDGRTRRADLAGGLAQLNTRQTPDLKNEVLDEARKTGRTMSEIVAEALHLYFQGKRQ